LVAMKEHIDEKKKNASGKFDVMAVKIQQKALDRRIDELVKEQGYTAKVKDTDFVFIYWILQWLPVGLVVLLLAVIFSAAMSSTSAELNALATTTMVDFYKRKYGERRSEKHYINGSRLFTLFWGLLAILFASMASLFDNLVEFVNILGSLFYGT